MNLTFEEKQQIETAIKNLTDILNKDKREPETVAQEKFNKEFNKLLKGSSQRYIDPNGKVSRKKTPHVEIFDKNGKWLLDYSTDPKVWVFWYSNTMYLLLRKKFSLSMHETTFLMKSLVETQFKMKGVQILIGTTD
jgi:hypothetical protein